MPLCVSTDKQRLRMKEVLQHDNTTLVHAQLSTRSSSSSGSGSGSSCCYSEAYIHIKYYLLLNEHGRVKLRNDNPSVAEVVGLLVTVGYRRFPSHEPVKKDAVLYGLLRESPSLWC
jgi:hypothetical protein